MSDERRLDDDEIAGILERAASAEQSSRSAPLGRAPTDAEWEHIVELVRATVGTTGEVESFGSLPTWRKGNAQVHGERDADGFRLRMGKFDFCVTGHYARPDVVRLKVGERPKRPVG